MEKKLTPSDLAQKVVAQEVAAYDWRKQGTDIVKFGTGGQTSSGSWPNAVPDSWTD